MLRAASRLALAACAAIEQWRTIIDVDLDGVFYACRAAIPVMAARGSGAIVPISSAIGTVGERNRSAYCAAKSGVENLTRAMALDHGREGIRANCVAPGLIDTPLIRGGKVGGGANPAAMQAMVDAHHAIGRIGQPAEVAAAFLASDDASFITGAVLPVGTGEDGRLARYLKWKASVWVGVGPKKPTAQASLAEMADTPFRKSPVSVPPSWMLGAWVQAVPSQRRARVTFLPPWAAV
jgi:hypothetical protein